MNHDSYSASPNPFLLIDHDTAQCIGGTEKMQPKLKGRKCFKRDSTARAAATVDRQDDFTDG